MTNLIPLYILVNKPDSCELIMIHSRRIVTTDELNKMYPSPNTVSGVIEGKVVIMREVVEIMNGFAQIYWYNEKDK